jgi:Carboxylesterase family
VRDARYFGNAAIQTVDSGVDLGARQSEDCLYLNIWSATLDPQARQPVGDRRQRSQPSVDNSPVNEMINSLRTHNSNR